MNTAAKNWRCSLGLVFVVTLLGAQPAAWRPRVEELKSKGDAAGALALLETVPTSAEAEEKEEQTLGLLRMTGLNALSILLGKSTSRLLGALLLLLAQFPFTIFAITLAHLLRAKHKPPGLPSSNDIADAVQIPGGKCRRTTVRADGCARRAGWRSFFGRESH